MLSRTPLCPPVLPSHSQPPQALQYRLREDLKAGGGDPAAAAFDQLRDTRGLEYELDRVANRAARDKQARPWAHVYVCATAAVAECCLVSGFLATLGWETAPVGSKSCAAIDCT